MLPLDSTVFVTSGQDIGWGIEVTGGRVYVDGSTDVGGHTDALLLAYDTNLNPLWDYSWGGAGDDRAYDITYYDGTLYVTGNVDNDAFVNAYTAADPIPAVSGFTGPARRTVPLAQAPAEQVMKKGVGS